MLCIGLPVNINLELPLKKEFILTFFSKLTALLVLQFLTITNCSKVVAQLVFYYIKYFKYLTPLICLNLLHLLI